MGRVVFVVTCVRIMAGSIRLSTSLNGVCRCSSLSNPFCGKPLRLSPFRPGLSPVRIGLVGEPGCFLLPCTFGSFGFLLPCTFGFTFRKSYASMLFASLALPLHPTLACFLPVSPCPCTLLFQFHNVLGHGQPTVLYHLDKRHPGLADSPEIA